MMNEKKGTKYGILKDVILKLRTEGKSLNEIVKILDCSKSTVSFHLKRNDVSDIGLKKELVNEEVKKEIAEFTKTNTIKNAMKKFNLGRSTIIKYATKKTGRVGYHPTEKDVNTRSDIFEYTKTHTLKKAMEKFNLSENLINKYSFKKGKNEISEEVKKEITKLRVKHTIVETAEILGISTTSVKKFQKNK
jgi:DNA-binding CsgD family transcriptional regulator